MEKVQSCYQFTGLNHQFRIENDREVFEEWRKAGIWKTGSACRTFRATRGANQFNSRTVESATLNLSRGLGRRLPNGILDSLIDLVQDKKTPALKKSKRGKINKMSLRLYQLFGVRLLLEFLGWEGALEQDAWKHFPWVNFCFGGSVSS